MFLTTKKKADYLRSPTHCPYCQAEMIEGMSFEADFDQAWQHIRCTTCEKEWIDIYTLTDIEAAK